MSAVWAKSGSLTRLCPSTSHENRSGSSVGLNRSSRIGDHSERMNSNAIQIIGQYHHGDKPLRRTWCASTPTSVTHRIGNQIKIQPAASKKRKTHTQSMKNHGTANVNAARAAPPYDSVVHNRARSGDRPIQASGHSANPGNVAIGCKGNDKAVATPPRISQCMMTSVAVTLRVTNSSRGACGLH